VTPTALLPPTYNGVLGTAAAAAAAAAVAFGPKFYPYVGLAAVFALCCLPCCAVGEQKSFYENFPMMKDPMTRVQNKRFAEGLKANPHLKLTIDPTPKLQR
jgi:hypothetical protein